MRGFCLEVWGPYACFSRPEMKVERVSYDVITPSAARAIYDAILWKPAISWRIHRIEVLNEIRWFSVRRNEVGSVASIRSKGIFIEDDRMQRAGLILRDVRYRIHADFAFISPENRMKPKRPLPDYLADPEETDLLRADETEAKYAAMFERRARKGQCFNQPYLGCREFSAEFRLVDPNVEPVVPIPDTRELGWMIYDIDFTDPDNPMPLFFNASLEKGIIAVPDRGSPEVRGA